MVWQTQQWNPWAELQTLGREFEQIIGRHGLTGAERITPLPVNVFGDEHRVVVTAELPGLDLESFDLSVTRKTIRLRGERRTIEAGETEQWRRRERPAKSFDRNLDLPFDVDPDTAEATYENGVLTVRVQRPEAERPRKVTLKT